MKDFFSVESNGEGSRSKFRAYDFGVQFSFNYLWKSFWKTQQQGVRQRIDLNLRTS